MSQPDGSAGSPAIDDRTTAGHIWAKQLKAKGEEMRNRMIMMTIILGSMMMAGPAGIYRWEKVTGIKAEMLPDSYRTVSAEARLSPAETFPT